MAATITLRLASAGKWAWWKLLTYMLASVACIYGSQRLLERKTGLDGWDWLTRLRDRFSAERLMASVGLLAFALGILYALHLRRKGGK
jgi:hypothetical protein